MPYAERFPRFNKGMSRPAFVAFMLRLLGTADFVAFDDAR